MLRCLISWLAISLASTAALAQVKLEHKFQPREKFETSSNAKIVQKLTIGDADIDAVFEEHALVESRVGEPRGDGQLPLVERFTAWQADLTAAGVQVKFDLAHPDERTSSDIDHFLDPQRARAKTPRTIVVDREGRVISLEGYDNLRDGLSDVSRKQNETLLDPQYYRNAFAADLDRLPAGEIREQQTWERTSEHAFYGNQLFQLTRQFKYVGPAAENGRTLDRIDIAVTKSVYSLGAGGDIEITAAPTELTVASTTGHLLFDRERGRIVRCEEKLHVRGDIKLLIGQQQNAVVSAIDLALTSDSTLLP